MQTCPAPTRGPLPCPSTLAQHLEITQKLLPRGEAWDAVFLEGTVLYKYWRSIARVIWEFTEEVCLMTREFFCSTRVTLEPDYQAEFRRPVEDCNAELDPCAISPIFVIKCEDIIAMGAASGWNITDCDMNPLACYAGCGCLSSGCDNAVPGAALTGNMIIEYDPETSPSFDDTFQAASGMASAGCATSGCTGSAGDLHCVLDRFLPAHIGFALQVAA